MNSCARVEEIEDLLLGNLQPEAAVQARAHLAECEVCQEEREGFAAEHALFTRRAPAIEPAPYLELVLPESDSARRRDALTRLVPALLAAAACFAVFSGAGEIHRGYEDPSGGTKAVSPSSLPSTNASGLVVVSMSACGLRSTAECAEAESMGRVAQRASDDGLFCETSEQSVCEEPLLFSRR